ncbi:MAG TPA: tetratricopeptide repeat protein [Candidatus Binatia bacterium]|jgi:tetratricopeptide (TPR) repeat protein
MNENKANQTDLRRLLVVSMAAFVFVAACATLQTEQDVKDGRVALMTGRPDDAVKYFSRAAESNPNYKTPYVLRESVWTYLGRAYYETGKYPEARTTLDKALASDNNDYVARLYLGMTLVRSNDPDRGRAEMETALNGIYEWLENLSSDSPEGNYWDTNKQIRKSIESGLAEKPAAIELVVTAQRVGKQLEEEIGRAQRDNIQSLYNQENTN